MNHITIQWVIEYQTRLEFQWSKAVTLLNGSVFKWFEQNGGHFRLDFKWFVRIWDGSVLEW